MNPDIDRSASYPSTAANVDPIESVLNQPSDPLRITAIEDDEAVVRLLEERLMVDRGKRKVGEIIVRKEVETRMVQVPVRRERLIVEQVGSEPRQLAAIDLGQGIVSGVDIVEANAANSLSPQQIDSTVGRQTVDRQTVTGTFSSLENASQVLSELTQKLKGQHQQVRVEIVLNDEMLRDGYQAWLDRHSS
jgi:hypothetical protein